MNGYNVVDVEDDENEHDEEGDGDDIVVVEIYLLEVTNYVVFRMIDYMNVLNDDEVEVEVGWVAL